MLKLLFLIEHQSKFCAYLEFLRKSESAHLNGGYYLRNLCNKSLRKPELRKPELLKKPLLDFYTQYTV